MLSFIENNCRFCTKVFCCKNCREKHEMKVHDVYPDCDICAYGNTVLIIPTDDLLNHIKEKHWPLHCVKCNRIFGAVNEFILDNKCPLTKSDQNTHLTPHIVCVKKEKSFDYDSLLDVGTFKHCNTTPSSNELLFNNPKLIHLTTSTPRTYNNDSLNIFGVITPSDSEVKLENCAGNTNSVPTEEVNTQQSKRRVTFNETPIYDSLKKTPNEALLLKSSLKKSTPETLQKSDYYDPPEENTEGSNVQEQIESPKIDATIWETASGEILEYKIVDNDSPNASLTMYDSCDPKLKTDNMTVEDITEDNIAVLSEAQRIFKKSQGVSIWTSMSCLVRSIVSGLSSSPVSRDAADDQPRNIPIHHQNCKRRRDDTTEEFIRLKKMKLTDIQCRKPINHTVPYQFYLRRRRPECCDKATQTN